MTRLYTRHGDDGTTGLYGGRRVDKHDPRVEAFGAVDEANCALGLAATAMIQQPALTELADILSPLQSLLFDLGADLCTPEDSPARRHIRPIRAYHVEAIERTIDAVCEHLPPLKAFILPGGCEAAARLHHARAVARRAERAVVALSRHEPLNPQVVIWLNRLSDLLFAMARRANQLAGVADVPWAADRLNTDEP